MKHIRFVTFFSVVLCMFAVVAAADSKKEHKVAFSDHVAVSGTQLEPGEYLVRWDGSGPDVQVKFLRDGKVVTSVTGGVVERRNPHESLTTNRGESDSRVLAEIDFSDVTLVLAPSQTSTPQLK